MKINQELLLRTAGICVFLFLQFVACGQVSESFSDGNFTENPEWTGDVSNFEVNTAGQLHLAATGSDTSILCTRNERLENTEWSFWMKLSFNTSANNHARIYLAAGSAGLAQGNTLYLQAGGSDDSLRVVYQTGMLTTTVFTISSYLSDHSTNALRFRIVRDTDDRWQVWFDSTGSRNYHHEGEFWLKPDIQAQWFGIYCRYTSSNSGKFWFDDIYIGPEIRDTVAPRLKGQGMPDDHSIQLRFSEAVEKTGAMEVSKYLLQGTGHPDTVLSDANDPALVLMRFKEPFPDGFTGQLEVRGLTDLAGNGMKDTIVTVTWYIPKSYDVVISEIMADPEPQVELPVGEYVELLNNTSFEIDLEDWTIEYGSNKKTFPEFSLPPHGRLIIAKDSVFSHYGACLTLFTSTSSLSNEGAVIILRNRSGEMIHAVRYQPEWYGGTFKEEGGWSLEMADPDNPCGCMENWRASVHPEGGTPGWVNSVNGKNPDREKPRLVRAFFSNPRKIEALFSEPMDSSSVSQPLRWSLLPGEINPDSVTAVSPFFDRVWLHFPEPFLKGYLYKIKPAEMMTDCAGNKIDIDTETALAMPDSIHAGDIVINEILHNPATDGARFVEIYNRSDKVLDLSQLVLGKGSDSGSVIADAGELTPESYLIFPGDHLALTPDPEDIRMRYHPSDPQRILLMEDFPMLDNDSGRVILAGRHNFSIVDDVSYNESMHYPLLVNIDGVSLERANPDLPSASEENWHSAAENAGFATPGALNSQRMGDSQEQLDISITPEIFSPDQDGVDDLLTITLHDPEPGSSISLSVFDLKGRLIRALAKQEYIGNDAVFIWDGITMRNTRAPSGIYILLIEQIKPDGRGNRIKKAAVLGTRFSN